MAIKLPGMRQLDNIQQKNVKEAGNIFVHTPDKAAQEYIQYVEDFQKSRKITWGCHTVDSKVTPMAAGQVTVLVARPGNGKTSLMIQMARRQAIMCDSEKKECVIYVSWEEPIESIEMAIQSGTLYTSEQIAFGRVDMDKVRRAALSRPSLPIIVIGYSMSQMSQMVGQKVRPPALYVERVMDSILSLYYDYGYKPTLICCDYIQKVPIDTNKYRDRTAGITEAMNQITYLAMQTSCPILLGAQAVRSVDNQGIPIPTLAGAQWSSAIEQDAFRMLGLYRPITSLSIGSEAGDDDISIAGSYYPADKNLLLMALLKQRQYYPPNNLMAVHFDPARFEMMNIDTVTKIPYKDQDRKSNDDFRIKEQV